MGRPGLRGLGDNLGNGFGHHRSCAPGPRRAFEQTSHTEVEKAAAPQGRHARADTEFGGNLLLCVEPSTSCFSVLPAILKFFPMRCRLFQRIR
jgi:hypothetical protein